MIKTGVWIRNQGGKEVVLHVCRKCGQWQNIGTNSSLDLAVHNQGKGKEEKEKEKKKENLPTIWKNCLKPSRC